ncbi:TonB-dependent siderophore receptor [Mucilaginibacter sp. BT774]|uniref:TonB-dependent receptor plug domain-containing protein n=1 Tax=Mucilaginibacter sp. BT774 TaxID=3062276 RepID=UPI0026769F3B|nr:TonB-dependent receptor [Mucilaginibacter sp. BT774]MDO3625345.1 TonB-dependent receptor [Mucilaginibacter sp. BT774]
MKKNYVNVVASLGLVQLALLNIAAHAQEKNRALDTVVVTATRSPKKLSETGRVVTIISAEQISRSQGKSLPELLNTVPGIIFSGANNAPGISSDVYVNGASTGNTLILVDGFPVNNASSIDGSYDLNAFPLDQIDHIEILKGSGSTLYGSDAVAGVINIITKHAQKQGLKASVQLSGGSYNTFKESAGVTGTLKNTGIAVNLSNTDSRGFPAATDTIGKGNFRNDDFHQRSASVNVNQRVTDKFSLNGNLQTTYNKGHLPYGAFIDDKNYTYNNTFLFAGIGAKMALKKGDLKFNLSQNNVWNNYNDLPNNANFNTPYHEKIKGRITNAEAIFNYGLNKYLDITSGADFKYSGTDEIGTDTLPSKNNNITSVYTSIFFKSDMFHLELGGRYNYHSKYGNNWTYTINPSVLLAGQFKLFAAVATAFKAPTLYQLSSLYGNGSLKPETTTSYEAGFDWNIISNALSFNTLFYKRDTKDVIYFKNLPDYPFGIYENGAFEHDKGFESTLTLKLGQVSASVYAAYVTGSQTDASGVRTDGLIRRPKNTYGANINYQVLKELAFGLNYKYTGGRADTKFAPVTYVPTPVTLKQYSLVDGHIQYQATNRLQLFGDLNNILNAKYTDWLGYNTRGINFTAGLKYQIN